MYRCKTCGKTVVGELDDGRFPESRSSRCWGCYCDLLDGKPPKPYVERGPDIGCFSELPAE